MDGMSGCPCGSGAVWAVCCGPIVLGEREAATAEALMRSRYTAYATGRIDHVGRTSGGAALTEFDAAAAARWASQAVFRQLEVIDVVAGAPEDGHGIVEFKAVFDEGGKRHVMRERSRFERVGGRWLYVGQEPHRMVKAGRNEACPCGSGAKFKRCCGR